jgi:hypothetical protein
LKIGKHSNQDGILVPEVMLERRKNVERGYSKQQVAQEVM